MREISPAAIDSGVGVMERLPTRRRLFYLPPGQAGASTADLGDAEWVALLKRSAWVPVAGGSAGAPRLVRPAQAQLHAHGGGSSYSAGSLSAWLASKVQTQRTSTWFADAARAFLARASPARRRPGP